MRWKTLDSIPCVLILAALALTGCQSRSADSQNPEASVSDQQKKIAETAKSALFERLSGRLMEVMLAEGPAAAIDVCSQEASAIANEVGQAHGVAIGRTSFKLRNPENAPRDWVKPFITERSDKPEYVALETGKAGVLFPITLQPQCLMCHGTSEMISEEVKLQLAKRYPDDQATGFNEGDLRGWFWVEVPAS